MNKKTVKVLEYNKIIDMFVQYAKAGMTRKLIYKMQPSHDIYEIRDMLAETTEAVKVLVCKGNTPLGSFYDIKGYLNLARKGATLTMAQLLKVLYNMSSTRRMKAFLTDDDLPELPILDSICEVLAIQKELENEIDRCIISEEEMSDNASHELRSIRRNIIRQNEAIKNKMNHIAGSADNKSMLQDAIVTIRDGRYVIPVKQEYRAKFSGIIHDQSSTGATLFIEPQAIVNMNNELKQLYLDEKAEIERILKDLTERVAEHYHGLKNNQKLLVKLDYIFAKGSLSLSYDGEEPYMTEESYMELKDAKHPLLDKKTAVPISFSIGKEYRTLVITGPNTGGKTVTLKTAGLLAMMAQSGLHIPASSESEIPVFGDIYADIGDEQSIEQSLSTFSSHMNNIVDIVKNAKGDSLVLIDELGAGTDPTEGAALAVAILEELFSKNAMTISTTHYNELKKYAISTPGVENASMEFDITTLSPTYRLLTGTPGKSNAFEISRKLGLSDKIIKEASRLIEGKDLEFEDVISALEGDKKAAEYERNEAERLSSEIKKQKEALDLKEKELKKKRESILKEAREEARGIIREAKQVSKDVQKELKELAKVGSLGDRNRILDENRGRLRELEDKNREKIVKEVNSKPVKVSDLKLGDRVKVLTLGQTGEITSLPDDRGTMTVQVGILKTTVNISDIMLIESKKTKTGKQKSSSYGSMMKKKTQNIKSSIDVRGKYLEDAAMEVDKFLDDAYMAGLKEVTVIHGRGEGILSRGIRRMLNGHKHTESFRPGEYNEGGDGVTVVTFKK